MHIGLAKDIGAPVDVGLSSGMSTSGVSK